MIPSIPDFKNLPLTDEGISQPPGGFKGLVVDARDVGRVDWGTFGPDTRVIVVGGSGKQVPVPCVRVGSLDAGYVKRVLSTSQFAFFGPRLHFASRLLAGAAAAAAVIGLVTMMKGGRPSSWIAGSLLLLAAAAVVSDRWSLHHKVQRAIPLVAMSCLFLSV